MTQRTKFFWALGSLGDNYAGNTIGQLKDAVYTVALHVPPELIGWSLSLPRLLDTLIDPVVGLWSDNTRTRWGRRRPYIFVGALGLGVAMTLLWMPPHAAGWSRHALAGYFLVTTFLFYAAYSTFLVPYRAFGLELTDEYHERTRLQGWGMMVGLIGGLGLPWLYKLTLFFGGGDGGHTVSSEVILTGARYVGAGVGLLVLFACLVPAITLKEKNSPARIEKYSLGEALGATLRNHSFLRMLGMNFCAIVGMYSTSTVSLLLSIYFLYGGDQQAAANLTGFLGMAQMLGSFVGVPVNTYLSVKIGKRLAAYGSLAIAAVGFGSLWFTLLPAQPYWAILSNLLVGAGMQGVWLMSATMNADVCDADELVTGLRREGMYGAVFAMEQKIAFSVTALLGGYLVHAAGYSTAAAPDPSTLVALRVMLVVTPLAGLLLAGICIYRYPLSQRRILEIQAMLTARRGQA